MENTVNDIALILEGDRFQLDLYSCLFPPCIQMSNHYCTNTISNIISYVNYSSIKII